MSNPADALDLYAKVEDMLGVYEAAPKLYAHYLLALREIDFDTLLDVGCGSGDFLLQMQGAFPGAYFEGIDLSPEMVRRARARGAQAECIDLCELGGSFDVITCVFDMLNYLSSEELPAFLSCLTKRLNPGGYLLFDLNTRYGFKEVAVGAFIAEDEDRFLTIDSAFDAEVYTADFTLFERRESCWHKSYAHIRQYEHDADGIAEMTRMQIVAASPVYLYGEEADKGFFVLR
ncbi:class I SAM-dependent methyltransferase [Nitratifractor sp.]|uniref:class I SAM-dependent methyltransferase n=1 Tax=Nitratifractor sp. TaxID=2268144 RepID=UPI0025D3C0FB|nr:class I SAM-dependent methyltransferase [Nitratifractor sp.]